MLKYFSLIEVHRRIYVVFACVIFGLLFTSEVKAQREPAYDLRPFEAAPSWVKEMYKTDADPGVVLKLYDAYYRDHAFVKNQHTQYLKRWISGLSKNVVSNPEVDSVYLRRYFEAQHRRGPSNWTTVGPIDWDHDAAGRSYAPGSAHVYTVKQSTSNPDILYAGTANAGVWKSTDHGLNWTGKTNSYLTGSVTSIEIDPTNANIVYAELLANIYKSTNGGTSWQPTGNSSFMSMTLSTRDIRCKPDQPNIVFAATDKGLFKTTDSGVSWTNVLSGNMQEIEFHPLRPDTMYVVRVNGDKTEFFRSLNTGSTFVQFTAGWPSPNLNNGEHQRRTELAVTPNAPDKVYALATGSANGGSGLYGVYVSSNLGVNWNFKCCGPQPAGPPSSSNPNLMGWSDQGLDDGGQYYYDLAFEVSPTNKDSIWVCGVNLWVSGNAGVSFVCPSAWSHSYKPNYVHADIHDLHFVAASGELWLAGDGGIFYSDDVGAHFYRRNVGIVGSDFWGLGMGHWYGNVMIGGAYHNGTLMKEENVYINGWICTDGGDGVGGFVNPGYDRQAYSNYNIKKLQSNRNILPVTRDFQFQPNSTYITGKSSDLLFHPHYYGTWYSGSGTKLYLTRDNGFTFEEIYDFGVDIAAMDLSLSDPQVIYACTFPDWWGTKRIYRSLNGGATWIEVTPPAAVLNNVDLWIPYDIAVDPNDPMKIWIVRTSMYNGYPNYNGYSVFTSNNGGASWTNISGTLLNGQYPTCLMHQRGTNGGIYIGTRTSVYYRNASMPNWELFNTGLPARTNAVKLLPWYRKGRIRSATDRSVWESPFYEPSIPIAMPAVQKQYLFCERDTAFFTDLSVLNETGVTWSWSFPGGTPSVSTIRNPKVVYKKPGIYDVSLIVHDVNGTDTATVQGMIIADNRCAVDTMPGGAMHIASEPGYLNIDNISLTTQTLTVTAWVKPNGIQPDYSAIWMNDGTAAGFNFREGNNTLGYHWPGGAWWWDSNLIVPADQWSYVAMVVQPGSVTLYVNGVAAIHNTAAESVNLGHIRIGSYQGWQGRTYKGKIDEVCVWNRALSEDEIRLQRHLVKAPANDGSIVGYYQFDHVESGEVIDKASGNEGALFGNAGIVSSDAPIGSGTSQIKTITSSGVAAFNNGGDMEIGFGTNHPNGKVVVSHLRIQPDTMPSVLTTQGGYWIINNYGLNQSFSSLSSMTLKKCGAISNEMAATYHFDLYTRPSNATGYTWTAVPVNTTSANAGMDGILNLAGLPSTTSFSQFVILRDIASSGIADVAITTPALPNPHIPGGESVSLLINASRQAMVLPVYSISNLGSLGAPTEGQMTFLSDSSAIIFFNGTQWMKLGQVPVLQTDASIAPINPVTVSIPEGPSNAAAMLSLNGGLVKLPSFIPDSIVTIDQLAPGMWIYDTALHAPRVYNGSSWQALSATSAGIPVSVSPPLSMTGLVINQDYKHPSSVLELSSEGGKAFLLPVARPENIYQPSAGLICFNPDINKLMVYDGIRWNILK